MAGDPTPTQPQTQQPESPAFQEWYVVTGGGTSALRMTPGLTVGESDSGALVLNGPEVSYQWVELVIADNGEPWATVVTRDKSLRVGGTTCLRHPLKEGATVRLPNNTFHISRDMRMPPLSGTVVEVVHREIPERQDLVGAEWVEVLAAVREPGPDTPAAEIPELADAAEPAPRAAGARAAETRAEPDRDAPDDWPDYAPMMSEPRRHSRPASTAWRRQAAMMAGVLALGAITVAGMVAMFFSDGENARLESFDPGLVATPPARSPAELPAPAAAPPGGAQTADSRPPPAVDRAPPSKPAPVDQRQVAVLPGTGAELIEPVTVPPVERRSVPRTADAPDTVAVPQTGDGQPDASAVAQQDEIVRQPEAAAPDPDESSQAAATDPEAADIAQDAPVAAEPEQIPSEPDPALVAELEEIGLMAQAVATDLTRRRDLLAADLALAQGRLTSPPESSAYTLYNRVLAQDPGSPEAANGLQSVRQSLINQALAQLAGGDLDDARRTLQAAADAGADPLLVADLRAEVDYRQQQTDDQAGG